MTKQYERQQQKKTSKHLMALLTFIALLPLVYFIPPWVAQHISDQHFFVTFISVALIVPIITYVAMPLMLKLITKR